MSKSRLMDYVFLHASILIYSFGSIFSKLASREKFLSFEYISLYGSALVILFFFALIWQQVLKRMTLSTAVVNKSIIVVWGIIWGYLFFNEIITLQKLLGTVIILIGLTIVVNSDDR